MPMEPPVSLLSVAQVRESERRALAVPGVDGLMLMRRAAHSALSHLREQWPRARGFTVLCGGGNNGGDGWMMAALGRAAGLDARVGWTHPPQALRGEAAVAAAEALAAGVPATPFESSEGLATAAGHCAPGGAPALDVIVDALLGIGIVEPVRAPIAAAIAAINAAGRPVLALDVPSGLCADSGRVLGTAVRADVTVTFIALKAGLLPGVRVGDARCRAAAVRGGRLASDRRGAGEGGDPAPSARCPQRAGRTGLHRWGWRRHGGRGSIGR